jgi:tetratricopeptide (TPR) repeat protein
MKRANRHCEQSEAIRVEKFLLKTFFAFLCFLTSYSLILTSSFAESKSATEEQLERRQKAGILSYFLKDPKDSKLPTTSLAVQSFNQAVEYYRKNEFVLARQALEESLQQESQNAFAYELLGDIDNLEQKLAEAKIHYEMAYNLEPNDRVKEKIKKLSSEVKAEKKFSSYDEEHFIIRYHRTDVTDKGFEHRELLRQVYRNLSKEFAYYFNKNKVVVLLYDAEEFKEITQTPHWVAGLYDGKVRMPFNRQGFTDLDLRALTTHEVTHAFVAGMSSNSAPSWINEGLAEYMENKVKPVDDIVLRSALKTGTLMPLDQLMAQNVTASLKDPLLISLFYQQSFSLVNYLVNRHGLFTMKKMLAEYGKGMNSDEVIRNTLQISVARLEQEWKSTLTN